MDAELEKYDLTIRQMRRFRVDPPVAKEEGLRSALLDVVAPKPERRASRAALARLRTLGSATALACGLALNMPNIAHGSQITLEMLRALGPLL